jgi:hypothetical protein
VLEFSCKLAEVGDDYRVSLDVIEMDEDTETIQVTIEGNDIKFEAIQTAITNMSGSLHSIDIVEVESMPDEEKPGDD